MSRKDNLDSFDHDWSRHLEWRKGGRRPYSFEGGEGSETKPGKYVDHNSMGVSVRLQDMPRELREAVIAELERVIGTLVDDRYRYLRAELVTAAKQEAARTLEELNDVG